MASFRELIVKIGADTGGLEKGLTSAAGSLTGLSATAVSVSAVGAAALLALGAAAFKVGLDFEESSRTIRAGTGATGAALGDLEASAKSVFGQVDESIGEVSKTLADLNTATGATGPTLEKLTEQMLDLKDLGVGFSGEVTNLTRVYGDWGIAIDDAAEANDYLFKVAQSTGAGVDDLANKIVQFGAPMRQLGFNFEESAALMGKWQKEGVNTETVMAGMRIGLANLSEAGGDVPAAFQAAIESIKSAGSTAEANSIAFEVFGKRAGADMSAAIREGRFSLDELMETLDASGDTIASVAKETETFGEKVSTMANKAMAKLEPLGSFLVDGLSAGLDLASEAVTAAGDSWDTWSEKLGVLNEDLKGLKDDLFPVTEWVYAFEEAVGLTKGTIDEAREATKQWQMQLASDAWEKAGSAIGWLVDNHLEPYRKTLELIQAKSNAKNAFGDANAIRSVADATKVGAEGLAVFAAQQAAAGEEVKKTEPEARKTGEAVRTLGGAAKEAGESLRDMATAMADADRDTANFRKQTVETALALNAARLNDVEAFNESMRNMGSALDDASLSAANAGTGITSEMLKVGESIQPAIAVLNDELPKAFESLESKGTAELTKLYEEAHRNFDLISDSGEATPRQINEAWKNELEALQELYRANGQGLSEEDQKTLDRLQAQLGDHKDKAVGIWGELTNQVSTIFNDLGRDVADGLMGLFDRGDYNDGLREQQDDLRASLDDRIAAYEDFTREAESKFDDFSATLAEKQAGQIGDLVEKLGEGQQKLAEFEEDRLKRIDAILNKEKKSTADATQKLAIDAKQRERDLKQFEVDKREDFRQDRLSKDRKLEEDIARIRRSGRADAEAEIQRLKQSHAAAIREEELELETSIARRKREYEDWVNDAETELKRKTAIEKREAEEAVEAEKAAIESRRGEYAKFTSDIEADIAQVKAAGAQALADEEEALKTSLATKRGDLTTFKEDTLADIAAIDGQYRTLWGDIGTLAGDTLKGVGESITRLVTEKLVGELFTELGKLVTEILPGVGGAFAKVFGGGGGSVPGVPGGDWKTPSVPGGDWGGGGGGAGGAASGAASGALGWANFATNLGTLVMAGFDYGKQMEIETALDKIEEATRRSEIHLGGPSGILNSMHTYLAANEWQRHGEVLGSLTALSDRISSDSWQQNANIWSRMDSQLPSIRTAVETNTSTSGAALQALAQAVQELKAIASRPVEVKLNEQKVGESVSEYLGAQI